MGHDTDEVEVLKTKQWDEARQSAESSKVHKWQPNVIYRFTQEVARIHRRTVQKRSSWPR